MPTLRLTGSPEQLLYQLSMIKQAIAVRKGKGYNVFQRAERWRYRSRRVPSHIWGGTCPTCLELDLEHGLFKGNNIPSLFGKWYWENKTRVIRPNTHETVAPQSKGVCQCRMFWLNAPTIMGNLIHNDFLAVI